MVPLGHLGTRSVEQMTKERISWNRAKWDRGNYVMADALLHINVEASEASFWPEQSLVPSFPINKMSLLSPNLSSFLTNVLLLPF